MSTYLGTKEAWVALVRGNIKRGVLQAGTVSSFLGPTCKPGGMGAREVVGSGWKLGGPASTTHGGPNASTLGHVALSRHPVSCLYFFTVGKGNGLPGAPAPALSSSIRDECHPQFTMSGTQASSFSWTVFWCHLLWRHRSHQSLLFCP